ncbi:restriction endonuclease subunit R [Mycolicibacterium agri]|uniref:Type I restriction enzyme endonuclease subunit n=1 Tax=Mycolicibacterium agri TaxID=36811 RepID=A0A2A7MPQ6_MYCAG|nr:HsdR family type I site-specific deoxyribonuclease [Mycolicibacterium agri]PEG33559.1 restriction endonuclease subunit R [Mycolicibacterium agri]GFG50767.1 restriction endonuclease [Mycolicibacterium agri]
MSDVGQPERATQNRVVKLIAERLGYEYQGNWARRNGNSNIDVGLLTQNLRARGYDDNLINKAVDQLQKSASVGAGHDLYEANREVYGLLRYGVKVKPGAGEHYETVKLIEWDNANANHFVVVEEVTVLGQHTKRPDVVLYVNGIALATLELKRSHVAVSEGIRQTIGNQKPEFIRPFFSTVQLVLAGNDVEGLHYGVIDTPEKYWMQWRLIKDIDEQQRALLERDSAGVEGLLDVPLAQVCNKERLLDIIHNFIVFDAGIKKTCRPNQYFGVKAAQARITKREGGIIWHTQGSGKSLTMVWLAKWIREHQDDARVLLITDRTELDDQIEGVFNGVNEQIYRTTSGADLIDTLNSSQEWLICSLVHKFRGGEDNKDRDEAGDDFIRELKAKVPKDFEAKGNIFVFVDEAHRTQSGKMHAAMKQLLPGAMFIGFTGTPLLKKDKATSIETFGSFIHTYKFDEAVEDGVVLDLRYEARTIDQQLVAPEKVDQWFDIKTKGMTDLSKAELKKRWGTIQKVVSAEPRARQIVQDILLDMAIKPRLMNGRGNALLVCESVYQATKFYELFVDAGFKGKCAIVSSYAPNASDIAKEDSGEGKTEAIRKYDTYRKMLADYFGEPEDTAMTEVEQFEDEVKAKFVKEPGQMRLLIVVDKLLTGFDAPSATYLYIDKKMRDHGLFQAICRVNRLDDEDKDYGYIVDYRDLFNSLESAVHDYTSGALDGYDKQDIEGLLTDRIEQAREDLDEALERIRGIVEAVEPPKNTLQYQQYFCAMEPGNIEQLKANEYKRVELYKAVAAVTRAYANLADDMAAAGYSGAEAEAIRSEIDHYVAVRAEVKLGAGEDIDFKQYEAGMRNLLDTYISASPSEVVSNFEDAGLIQLIVKLGKGAITKLPTGIQKDPEAVAETIVNNMRKVIVDEHPTNPKYYESMSKLLDDILELRRQQALDYEAYLAKLLEAASALGTKEPLTDYPESIDTDAKRALYDSLDRDEELALAVDKAVRDNKRADWIGNALRERRVENAIIDVLPDGFDEQQLEELMKLVTAQRDYI